MFVLMRITTLAVTGMVFWLLPVTVAAQIPNASFESHSESGTPTDWQLKAPSRSYTWPTINSEPGGQSPFCLVTSDDGVSYTKLRVTSHLGFNRWIQSGVFLVTPLTSYTVSAWFRKRAGSDNSWFEFFIIYYRSDATPMTPTSHNRHLFGETLSRTEDGGYVTDGGTTWTQFTSTAAIAPATAVYARVHIVGINNTDSFYVDKLSLAP